MGQMPRSVSTAGVRPVRWRLRRVCSVAGLEELEVTRCELRYILEAVEGVRHVLEQLEVMRYAL